MGLIKKLLAILFAISLIWERADCAISADVIWEVRTTGNDTNGGGFKDGASGTDWSQQDAAQYSVTDAVTNGTTTITSATANFGTDVVGNVLYIQGGTGSITAGWYEITARTNSTTITVDRSTGLTTGTGATLKIGGALASIGQAGAVLAQGNTVYVKSGTYTISSTSQNVANGIFNVTGGSYQNAFVVIGYDSTRSDWSTLPSNRPIFQVASSGVTSVTVFTCGNYCSVYNIVVDGNSKSSIRGLSGGTYSRIANSKAINCTNSGFSGWTYGYRCEASGNATTGYAFGNSNWEHSVAHDNSVTGFQLDGSKINNCLSYRNSVGFSASNVYGTVTNSIAAYNTSHGFSFNVNAQWHTVSINNVAYGNGGEGFSTPGRAMAMFINNAGGNNTSGNYSTTELKEVSNFITLTADPFNGASSTANEVSDFSLNDAAGGGALLKQFNLKLLGSGTTTYLDIGGVQSKASTSSGGTRAYPFAQ